MDIADKILKANGVRASGLGLRFDRVALSLLADLRSFAETAAPEGVIVLAAITAPIRMRAKTANELKRDIAGLLGGGLLAAGVPREDRCAVVHGNAVRLRLLAVSSGPKFIGFVHNPDSPSTRLLDLAEQWLRGQADG